MIPDTREDELRFKALELACGTQASTMLNGTPPDQVVGRAESYLKFLKGGEADANG